MGKKKRDVKLKESEIKWRYGQRNKFWTCDSNIAGKHRKWNKSTKWRNETELQTTQWWIDKIEMKREMEEIKKTTREIEKSLESAWAVIEDLREEDQKQKVTQNQQNQPQEESEIIRASLKSIHHRRLC